MNKQNGGSFHFLGHFLLFFVTEVAINLQTSQRETWCTATRIESRNIQVRTMYSHLKEWKGGNNPIYRSGSVRMKSCSLKEEHSFITVCWRGDGHKAWAWCEIRPFFYTWKRRSTCFPSSCSTQWRWFYESTFVHYSMLLTWWSKGNLNLIRNPVNLLNLQTSMDLSSSLLLNLEK